jgi:AcrR family transcriptional regulator
MIDPQKHPKYQSLISTARALFRKHGFRRVTIEEVCKKSGVSKMTFYRFFPNKIELAKTVFDVEIRKGMETFREIMTESIPASQKIHKMLLIKLEGTNDISKEFLMDFYNSPELGLNSYIEEQTRKVWTEILGYFRQAQESGWFRKDFRPEFIMHISSHFEALVLDKNLLQLYNSPQDLIMELTNFFVYGISPHD